MKIYLASSSKFIEDCQILAKKLEDRGHEITRKWWNWYIRQRSEYKNLTKTEFYSLPIVKFINKIDLKAVDDADIVIAITKDEYKLTGGMIELGHARNKIVIVIGQMKQSSMVSSFIHFNDHDEFFKVFDEICGLPIKQDDRNIAEMDKKRIMTCDCGSQKFKYLMIDEVMICTKCKTRFLW